MRSQEREKKTDAGLKETASERDFLHIALNLRYSQGRSIAVKTTPGEAACLLHFGNGSQTQLGRQNWLLIITAIAH